MRKYIVVWLVGILLVDMAAFGFLVSSGGGFIKCNREYKKVYCEDPIGPVFGGENALEESLDYYNKHHEEIEQERERRANPQPHEVDKKNNDLKYYGEIIGIITVVLVGIAVFLYMILAGVEKKNNTLISISSFALVIFLIISGYAGFRYYRYITTPGEISEVHYAAPIIYLYDEQEREATVKLDLNGELTCTYPKYNDETGWVVKTSADGVLTDSTGRQYEYLYWEADIDMVPDLSKGFCVRGEDSAAFLEKALSDLGLTDTEANAFIMYWLPQLEENPYNIVTFQTETYENVAKLDVDPIPDTVVRVNMLFYGTVEYVEIEAQDLSEMNPSVAEREGFVLVEWGGGKLG